MFGGAAVAVAISGLAAGVALSAPAVGIVLAVLGALAGAVMAVVADRRSAAEWQPVPHAIKPAAASRRTDRRSDPRCNC